MKLNLAILDENRRYLEKLAVSLDRMKDADVSMVGFTTLEETKVYLDQNAVDLLLVSDAFADQDTATLVSETDCVKIVLTSAAADTTTDQRAVFKFQPSRVFLENVKDVYYTYLLNKCNTIAFGSPIGGCGASSLAVASAKMLAQHSRVLSISLEALGGSEAFFHAVSPLSAQSVDELLALHITECEPPAQSFAQIAPYCTEIASGLYALPLDDATAREVLTTNQLSTLLQMLKKVKVFDYIILDLGTYHGAADQYALFDTIIVPAVSGEVAGIKLKKLCEVLTLNDCALTKCKVMYNKCPDATLPRDACKALDCLAVLPQIEASTAQDTVQQMVALLQEVPFQ